MAVIALSCAKEQPAAPVKMKTVTVSLGAPVIEPTTKTILGGENGTSVEWRGDDVNIVAITNGAKGENWYLFTSTDNERAAVKTFTGSIPETEKVVCYFYDLNKADSFGLSKYTAYETVRVILPYDQSCWSYNSFPQTQNFALALAGENPKFKSCCGYFKWTNNGDAIKSVKFETVTEHEYFAGYFNSTISAEGISTEKYVYNEGNQNACSKYVNSKDPHGTITADSSYYAIVIPGEFHGMKMTITLAAGGTVALVSSTTFTVQPGKYIDLGVLPVAAISKAASGSVIAGLGDFPGEWVVE